MNEKIIATADEVTIMDCDKTGQVVLSVHYDKLSPMELGELFGLPEQFKLSLQGKDGKFRFFAVNRPNFEFNDVRFHDGFYYNVNFNMIGADK